MNEEEGTTVVMVSHSMEDVVMLASRVAVLSHGKLSAIGTPEEIFSQPELIEAAGLRLPEAAQLCLLLRRRGLDLPPGLIRLDEMRERLLSMWKEVSPC